MPGVAAVIALAAVAAGLPFSPGLHLCHKMTSAGHPERRRPRWRPRRCIHMIDAENIARSARPTPADLDHGRLRLDAVVPYGDHDHRTVAADAGNALAAGLAWPGAQLLIGHGPNGADAALLRWAEDAALPDRFDAVVIASGDNAFAPLAAALRRAGLSVVVASWRTSCSRGLARAATSVRWLDPVQQLTPGPFVTTAQEAGEVA
jgi:hypothetical protein